MTYIKRQKNNSIPTSEETDSSQVSSGVKNVKSLKTSMMQMVLFGWFLPLAILSVFTLTIISGKLNSQTENMVSTSVQKTLDNISLQLDDCIDASREASYTTYIRDAWRKYQVNQSNTELYETTTTFLNRYYKYDSTIKDAILIYSEMPETMFYTFNNSNNTTYQDIRFFELTAKETILEKSAEIDTRILLMNTGGRLYLVRNVVDARFRTYAVLILELNQQSLEESLKTIWGYKGATLYFNNRKILSTDTSLNQESAKDIQKDLKQGEQMYFYTAPSSCAAYKKGMRDGTTTIVASIDNSVVYAELRVVKAIMGLLFVFMIPLFIMVFGFFHKNVTSPVQDMIKVAKSIEEGNYGIQVEYMANSEELYYMEESLNHMSTTLKNQFEKIYLEEIALRDAKIMALQSQINPHFLNNTLEIINWEARMNENYKVSGMIEALSTMLEATTNRRSQSYVTLAEEMAYVDAYLYIIAQRLGTKFHCEKEIDETLMEVKVPRLIIQPVVENAVEHGIDMQRKGEVKIRIYKRDTGFLAIEVEDSGTLTEEDSAKIHKLLTEEPDPNSEKRISLGIRNVDQRLKIIYGSGCGLFIHNNASGHTVSTMLIRIEGMEEQ